MKLKALLLSTALMSLLSSATVRAAEIGQAGAQSTPLRQPSVNRSAVLLTVLDEQRISGQTRSAAVNDFAALTVGEQDAVLSLLSPRYAEQSGRLISEAVHIVTPTAPLVDLTPKIATIKPEKGTEGDSIVVLGTNLNSDCKVQFGGSTIATDKFMDMLVATVPSGKVHGQSYFVRVQNTKLNKTSDSALFQVIAPAGYRGTNGWKFVNFASATTSWDVFRDFFGAWQVEFPGGIHRLDAQEWYDSTYKKVGAGGECLGMSIRSIRTRMKAWQGLYASWWPGHTQPTIWDYDKLSPQVVESIQEDQGSQLSAQNIAMSNYLWNNQSPTEAWSAAKSSLATGKLEQMPIVCFWQNKIKGHAVVGYRTGEDKDYRYIYVYDSNKPYSESEQNDRDSVCRISKSTGQFSYNYGDGSVANRVIVFPYFMGAWPMPLLPAQAYGESAGKATGTTIVVVEAGQNVRQITDDQGRTFFTGNSPNENAATRIPDSMLFVPLSGNLPPDFPAIYVFNNTPGKSLTFDMDGSVTKPVRIFSPGVVTKLSMQSGRFKLDRILTPNHGLILTNPNTMHLTGIDTISVEPDKSERVFELRNLQNLKSGNLGLRFAPGRNGLQIDNASTGEAKLDLNMRSLSSGGARETGAQGVTIGANQLGSIAVQDFRNLNVRPQLRTQPR